MTDTTDQQAVTVAQADREAATLYWQSQDIGSPETYAQIRAGRRDDSHLIRAFARHRLASVSSASAEALTAIVQKYVPLGVPLNKAMREACIEDIVDELLAASPEPVPETNQAREVGMKPWQGGTAAPSDWDATKPVRYRDGSTGILPAKSSYLAWANTGSWIEITAYTPALATQPAMSQPEEAWMNDPLSLDAGLPATSQEEEACICGGVYTMCEDGHAINCPASNQRAAYLAMTAATPTPPTLSEDLREALSDMLEAFTNSECGEVDRRLAVETARAALAQVKAS